MRTCTQLRIQRQMLAPFLFSVTNFLLMSRLYFFTFSNVFNSYFNAFTSKICGHIYSPRFDQQFSKTVVYTVCQGIALIKRRKCERCDHKL